MFNARLAVLSYKNINKKHFLCLIFCFLVFAILFLVRVHFIDQKEGLHLDEVLSIALSNCSDFRDGKFFDEKVVYAGKQIKEPILWNSTSIWDAFSDVKKLYIDNRDRPHTNLFYSCFRLWFAGIATTDTKEIIERGCRLNLLFFCLSFLFLYKLLRKIFGDAIVVPFSLFIAFANTGSISNTLFMRPYQLQETLLILFSYMFVQCYEAIENETFLNSGIFCKLVLSASLTLLSGYFAAIYVLMLWGILLFLAKKQLKNFRFLYMALIVSFILARFLFRGFFYGFSCGRAGEAFKKFICLDNYTLSYEKFCKILGCHLFEMGTLWVIFLTMVSLLAMRRRYQFDKKAPLIFLSCFIWSFGNMFFAPYKELRYIMPCFPLMTLVFPFIIVNLKGIWKYLMIADIAFCTAGFWDPFKDVDYLLKDQNKEVEFFAQKTSIPVLILLANQDIWKCAYVLHNFSDMQRYEFPRTQKSLETKLKKYDSAIVLFSNDYGLEEKQSFLPKNFQIISKSKCSAFFAYELKRIP